MPEFHSALIKTMHVHIPYANNTRPVVLHYNVPQKCRMTAVHVNKNFLQAEVCDSWEIKLYALGIGVIWYG